VKTLIWVAAYVLVTGLVLGSRIFYHKRGHWDFSYTERHVFASLFWPITIPALLTFWLGEAVRRRVEQEADRRREVAQELALRVEAARRQANAELADAIEDQDHVEIARLTGKGKVTL
jgi:hypothetical protein